MTVPTTGGRLLRADIVVVGGGLAGLSAALALTAAGFEVVVIEARTQPPQDAWGWLIWPQGVRTLARLGMLRRVTAAGCTLRRIRWYLGDGRPLFSLDLDRLGGDTPFVGILPSRLESMLAEEASRRRVTVLTGVERWSLDRDEGLLFHVRAAPDRAQLRISSRLAVGADGPNSKLRTMVGIPVRRWRPRGQAIVTGIGGRLGFQEVRQAIGAGWSGGCQTLGEDASWLYAVVRRRTGIEQGVELVRACGDVVPDSHDALKGLAQVRVVRPWSLRVSRWADDRVLLIGDAAHAMLPHLGLGGSSTLEDIPVLAEIVSACLGQGQTGAGLLQEFQARRAPRVALARRVTGMLAFAMTNRVPGLHPLRDWGLERFSMRPERVEALVRQLIAADRVHVRALLARDRSGTRQGEEGW